MCRQATLDHENPCVHMQYISDPGLVNVQVESPFKLVQSDLFECEVHLEEICDILCIAATGKADSKQAPSQD